eukprot:502476-Rhodomonas_salina.1
MVMVMMMMMVMMMSWSRGAGERRGVSTTQEAARQDGRSATSSGGEVLCVPRLMRCLMQQGESVDRCGRAVGNDKHCV